MLRPWTDDFTTEHDIAGSVGTTCIKFGIIYNCTEASSPLIVIKCGFYMQLVLELQQLITSLREHLAFMCIIHTLWLLVSSIWTSAPWFGSQAIFIWEKEKNSQCL